MSAFSPLEQILTGRTQSHLVKLDQSSTQIHQKAREDFLKLSQAASKEGFDLKIASGFRSLERQLLIFNQKAHGKRDLLDHQGKLLDYSKLSDEEILWAILRWSAIPGASRHHWGTDIDIYDQKAMDENYQLQLTPWEFEKDGPFYALDQWLDERIHNQKAFGFYRPLDEDRGGIACERWHLSYAPLSRDYMKEYSFDLFIKNISELEISLKSLILENAEMIYKTYILS